MITFAGVNLQKGLFYNHINRAKWLALRNFLESAITKTLFCKVTLICWLQNSVSITTLVVPSNHHRGFNSFPARGGISRPFWVLRPKRPQKRSKNLCDLVERWLVRKLKSSAFQNAIARQMNNFFSENTTLWNQAINLAALHSGTYRKKYHDTG